MCEATDEDVLSLGHTGGVGGCVDSPLNVGDFKGWCGLTNGESPLQLMYTG